MRKGVVGLGLGCLALVVVACGGNVVVDGTATTTGSTSTFTGTGASAACSDLSGEQLTNGCQADAQCNGSSVSILCNTDIVTGTGGAPSTCSCQINGSQVGTCQEPAGSSNACNPTNGCCGVYFSTSGG